MLSAPVWCLVITIILAIVASIMYRQLLAWKKWAQAYKKWVADYCKCDAPGDPPPIEPGWP